LTTKELDETAQSQTRPKTRMQGNDESGTNAQPASLRLQEYLKSLEEKINSFQALSRSSEPDFTSTKKPTSNESRFNSVTGVYSSEVVPVIKKLVIYNISSVGDHTTAKTTSTFPRKVF